MTPHTDNSRRHDPVREARAFLRDPQACHDNPHKRLMAFAVAKSAAGQRMVQSRLRLVANDVLDELYAQGGAASGNLFPFRQPRNHAEEIANARAATPQVPA